jgi:hypothetical protein
VSVDNVRYVDTVGDNFLYRGGKSLTTDSNGKTIFDYGGLQAAIKNVPNPPPMPPPASYYLVVVNLQHSNEGVSITAEADFFSESFDNPNRNKGQGQFWDTYGTDQCYFQTEPRLQKELTATLGEWLPDPLIWRVATLRCWLEDPSTLPLQPLPDPKLPILVYVHCSEGCDRTSEMIGGYRLRHMPSSWTMQTAWSNMCNEHPCSAVMGCNNYMALQWYAFWLNQTLGFSLTGIGQNDGGCNNAGKIQALCSPPS